MKELTDFLEEVQKEVNAASEKISGVKDADELFNENFMKTHTHYSNFKKWLSAGGFDFDKWDSIQESDLNIYVSKTTDFQTFSEMDDAACDELVKQSLNNLLG